MTDFEEFRAELARQLGPSIDSGAPFVEALFSHYELLVRWNRHLNLTRDVEMRRAVERHYAECAWFWLHRQMPCESVVDVGSGAGFPGIVIAALSPDIPVSLIESHSRKAVFLKEATRGAPNVEVLCARAGDIGSRFDVLVSRAVSWKELRRLVPMLSRQVGLLISEDDCNEVRKTGGIEWNEPLKLPWGDRRVAVWGSVPRGT